jgi:hypothetical protein
MPVDFVAIGADGGRTAAANMTPEQRTARARKAAKSRVNAAARIAELEARFGGELDSLRAEVADLRQRVAA